VRSQCTMMSDGSFDPAHVTHPTHPQTTPIQLSGIAQQTLQYLCPNINSTAPVCCNSTQLIDLTGAFVLIDIGFATCPACVKSLHRMWCDFTCSPKQAEFVKILSMQKDHPNWIEQVSFSTTTKFQEQLWESCADTGIGVLKNRNLYGNVTTFLTATDLLRHPSPDVKFAFDSPNGYVGSSVPCETICDCEYCKPACKKTIKMNLRGN
jgi:hypothetical protein